jgi:ABC-type sugar transport system ATPase subunit
MATIELRNVCKRFERPARLGIEAFHPITAIAHLMQRNQGSSPGEPIAGDFVMENLDLTIPDGKVMVVLGPSGCGKSTLLRLIAGLVPLDSGEVYYDDLDMAYIPTGERNIGMVFQNYALYPHFTSKKNILSYFQFKKRTPELDQLEKTKYMQTSELLGVDIEYLLDKNPGKLSGGERQRVALGRCITREPDLFLLDEPFSNLDQQLREKYRVQLKKLLVRFNITTVYVTHDQQEALILADVIAIMNRGNIEQVGTPEEIYNYPENLFVAEFLNLDIETPALNLLDGQLISTKYRDFQIGVRPGDIELCDEQSGDSLSGAVIDIHPVPLKRATILYVSVGGEEISVQIPERIDVSINDRVALRFSQYHLFDKKTGKRVRSHS